MTASPDDGSDRPDDVTAAPVDGSAKKPPAKTAAAKSKAAAARPRTSTAKTTAEKAAAVKSGEAKAAAAKSATARTAAAKTAAVKSAAARTAASKTAAKTAAAKATTARTAAAKAAAAKAAAAKAAAVKAATLDESTASTASRTPAAKRTPAKRTPAKTTTAKTTPAKKPTPATSRTTKPREAKPTARPRPAVAADDAAPTGEAIASPIGEIEIPAQDAVADDTLFADLLALDPADAESGTGAAIVDPVTDATVVTPVGPEPAEAEPEEVMGVELAPERDTETVAAAAATAAAAAAVAEETTSVPASAPPAVILRDLIKDFGDQRAVNSIDLTVPAGSFYGIVGPNGAGKTTTLSILAGLLRATSGQVVVCGIDQASDALSAKRLMGVLPDRLRTFDRLTGRQLLHYYGLLRGLAAEVIEKRTADLARAFDLADALNRVVSDYSAGMTKKIMLAGAMIHSPRVLVLDEPFEAVDPVSSAVILDILRAYVAHGGTVILSSHGMDLVERVCSRVAIIVGGEVLAEGTIDEVRAGQTLESRFVELSGGVSEVEGLEWLHTFSD
ncbi:ABC transporter ATP-binding protein [Microbacterium profundi]|uniref:ABC transporter ATP-binding protein n=1 Tax=Microbacterium profundi TaxID=450380 RepID=UPI0027E0F26F|nr:ABC transporter ATP-binding protein [Microbacterium profundi]MCE7482279.1 ABC transporter ATP-binding protein [Microbacterium profundi]